MGALPTPPLPRRIKEILHRQKGALRRARDMIRRQAEELESLRALLARRLGLERNTIVEIGATVVECPPPFDGAMNGPTAKA